MGALNPELCGSFFKLVDNAIDRMEEVSGSTKLTLDRIPNIDEIGFTINLTAGYTVTRKKFMACTCCDW